ncbi:ShlB/FhaC/HecB family hemolysin secretion/activation protein [Spirulina sp. CS-785/01]|uniref:ShlB/FhaC/HecB family hemolysin secretion/activation protein n=1 Tax=Spirulina sp. CS-785/01 TaxID=3021716 RepID=UPI00232DB223|nr:ShlB/FhaC/HecB family hemolysin secretion/activation protein [Spirulina sp. CS-785/01]MDB9311686.1 ShlB/FhaC/HecB family hemolysin secretion/activation protein [Spirulina sp. CS-785/01]
MNGLQMICLILTGWGLWGSPVFAQVEDLGNRVTQEQRFFVQRVEVVGDTVLEDAVVREIVAPLEGREVTLRGLQEATDGITQLYLDQGYITTRAVLGDQAIREGVVRIQVITRGVSEIVVTGTEGLAGYVRDRLNSALQTPLQINTVQDQLRLLRRNPLIQQINATLRTGEDPRRLILAVEVEEAKRLQGQTYIDNYSPVSVGSERLGVDLSYGNLAGWGDQLGVSYSRSTTGGSEIWDLNYNVPLNPQESSLQLRAVFDQNRVTQEEFQSLDIRGESQLYEVSFRHPIIRTAEEELGVSLGLSFRDGQTFLFNNIPQPFGIGPEEDGTSRVTVLRLSQDYFKREERGGWTLRSQFNFGLDWFNSTLNPEPIPDSRFFSWLVQGQRLQRLSENHLLVIQLDWQFTPNSLLPSEQYVIGGGQSLRGYRQNLRSGDNGVRVTIENRITVNRDVNNLPTFQFIPFLDLGTVWNHEDNPNTLPEETFLMNGGLGVFWTPPGGLQVRFDYGIPLIEVKDAGENAQDLGVFFRVLYEF